MVSKPEVPEAMAGEIIQSAKKNEADLIVTACPLCQFNLDYPQREEAGAQSGREIPVVYFTQLMAVALDLPRESWGIENHYVDPMTFLDKEAADPS